MTTQALIAAQERSVIWDDATGLIEYVDQRLLPQQYVRRRISTVDELVAAIASLAIRGAPAIGIAGGYGVVLAAHTSGTPELLAGEVARIRRARPTAVNLAWAVDRVASAPEPLREAYAIHAEQIACDQAIAEAALPLLHAGMRVLTHCHTGALATAGSGTALGALIHAYRAGQLAEVYVDETRPLLQGARLTMWELQRAGVPATLLIDGAAATLMAQGRIDAVMVGADRIAKNRDTANKIGTYGLAVQAQYHRLPFYVAAPRNTFDPQLATGSEMIIEERAAEEVHSLGGMRIGAEGAVYNPAFDVTPGSLITAIIREDGLA